MADITVAAVGYAAACCSTASFAPQAWKIIKSRETKDLSAGMYGLTVSGFALWTVFGALGMQWPLIMANFICLLLSAFILVMKLLPQPKKDAVADTIDPEGPA
jgi:MtN3 and saliva related transmembrane protein